MDTSFQSQASYHNAYAHQGPQGGVDKFRPTSAEEVDSFLVNWQRQINMPQPRSGHAIAVQHNPGEHPPSLSCYHCSLIMTRLVMIVTLMQLPFSPLSIHTSITFLLLVSLLHLSLVTLPLQAITDMVMIPIYTKHSTPQRPPYHPIAILTMRPMGAPQGPMGAWG